MCYCTILKPALWSLFAAAPLESINKLFTLVLFSYCVLYVVERAFTSELQPSFRPLINVSLFQLHVFCLVQKTQCCVFPIFTAALYFWWPTHWQPQPFALWTRFVCGQRKRLMTSHSEVSCQQLWYKSSAPARNPVASVKKITYAAWASQYEAHTVETLHQTKHWHIRLESIYKSLPTVTVIVGPSAVPCICGWCASKTHKPTHIPKHVSTLSSQNHNVRNIFLLS